MRIIDSGLFNVIPKIIGQSTDAMSSYLVENSFSLFIIESSDVQRRICVKAFIAGN